MKRLVSVTVSEVSFSQRYANMFLPDPAEISRTSPCVQAGRQMVDGRRRGVWVRLGVEIEGQGGSGEPGVWEPEGGGR